jgi:hypothetical protein
MGKQAGTYQGLPTKQGRHRRAGGLYVQVKPSGTKPRPLWNRWFPSWLGILLFPYEHLPWTKAFSDQCYELIINAGGRRLRICAIWP